MAGTSATLLARRWESALLVNVDNDTLARLMADERALKALMSIEGFRSLNKDIETIINKSEAVKKAKIDGEDKLTTKQKKELTDAEKESKSLRKQIQEKLIKFATRVPIFMYLTDERERSLRDVITEISPGLFKKVTNLDVKDFELLCTMGLFNSNLMNQAIFQFKRYEDASLTYTGIDRHDEDEVGGWDVSIRKEEFDRLFYNQQNSMTGAAAGAVPPEPAKPDSTPKSVEKVTVAVGAKPALVTEQYGYSKPEPPKQVQPAKPAPEAVEIDLSGIAVGSIVKHKMFGSGKVTKLDSKYIRVEFDKGEKIFLFPDCFKNGFLSK